MNGVGTFFMGKKGALYRWLADLTVMHWEPEVRRVRATEASATIRPRFGQNRSFAPDPETTPEVAWRLRVGSGHGPG